MYFIWIVLAILLALALGFISIYNALIKNKNLVQESFSGMDVQLKRRADLIPNLIETVQGYKIHEREVLTRLTDLRTQSLQEAPVREKGRIAGSLSETLGRLWAVAENYPNLKANENFIQLQKTLADLEEQIQLARRYYNGTVRNFNILLQSFPSNLVANVFNFTPADFFMLEEENNRAVPKVQW